MFSKPSNTDLHRIAYSSVAAVELNSLLLIADILAVSQRNNARDRVTGALVYSDGRFFQILEGASADIDRVLARIVGDPRHREINIVSRIRVEGRLFPDWSMHAPRISPGMESLLKKAISSCDVAPQQAIEIVRRMVAEDGNHLTSELPVQRDGTHGSDQSNQN